MCSAAQYSIIAAAQTTEMDAERYLTELFSHPAGTLFFLLSHKLTSLVGMARLVLNCKTSVI